MKFGLIRPTRSENLNIDLLRRLEDITEGAAWAQEVTVSAKANYCSDSSLVEITQFNSTDIQSEPLGIAFIGARGVQNLYSEDKGHAPVIVTCGKTGPLIPHPFGCGIMARMSRKLGINWGKEYSLYQLTKAIFDGNLLIFGTPGCGTIFDSGLLIQTKYSIAKFQRYNVR